MIFDKMNLVRRALARAAVFGLKGSGPIRRRGKSPSVISQTQPAGSWEAIVGTIAWQDADSVWNSYTEAQKEAIVRSHAVVYACVRKLTSAFQEAPIAVGTMDGREFEPDLENPLNDLMAKPNFKMSYEEFVSVLIANLVLSGESYIWEWRDRAGYLKELWPIPKSWVTEVRNQQTKQLESYTIKQGSKVVKVALQDMTMLWFPDPSNPTRGLAPLAAALQDVQTDQERANFLVEMIHNLKYPGLILKQPEGWDDEQKAEARQLIHELIGTGQRGGPLFLEGEKATAEVIAPLKDLDWPGVASLSETRICAAFGVPPITIHLRSGLDKGTYSNYKEANRAFYSQTMVALWKFVSAGLTRGLITEEAALFKEDTDMVFRYDTSEILELQEDQDSAAKRATQLFLGGLITRNEGRIIANQEPVDPVIGDVFLQPVTLLEVPLDTKAARILPPANQHTTGTAIEDGTGGDE